jgi:hypothetical protein
MTSESQVEDSLLALESKYKTLSKSQLADEAIRIARMQIMACFEFKKPRLAQTDKFYALYDGKVPKKLRQLFNVPIPVFAGMIDTLNAQYDTGIILDFKEGDASDYFKVQKINGAWRNEVMNTSTTSKWDSKLRMARKHAIMTGRGIMEYNVTSDPSYKSELNNVMLKNFNFQPRGGLYLENHLFAGTEDIDKTRSELIAGARAGIYDKEQVAKLIERASSNEFLPDSSQDMAVRLARFKPLGLDADMHSYVGQDVYKLAQQIIELDGQRYYILFHPWTNIWVRFDKWKDVDESDLMPWVTFATHEDDENFLSKGYADDLYPSADAIIAMFNQELTNREKRNFGARAYDKDMFTDVRKLDEAMHRPDALVPADTKGGSRRISEGVYEFKVGELGGTVNLIDWITGTIGRSSGATDLAQGGVQEVSKKASVTFAEQKSVSKRIGWGAQPFQDMMGDLGGRFIWGLKNHMPARMAIQVLGETGYDWDEITRMDLNTTKDINVLISSSDQKQASNEMKSKRRAEALGMVDPNTINPQWRNEQILRSVGEFEDEEIAQAQDVQTYNDRKSLSKASEAINTILLGKEPLLWYGATAAFMQKIHDFASDKQSTLGDKFEKLINYSMAHAEIVKQNVDRKVAEQSVLASQAGLQASQGQPGTSTPPAPAQSEAANPGMSGGMSRAMNVATASM